MLRETFPKEDYRVVTHSISILKANIVALFYPIPFVMLYLSVYFFSISLFEPVKFTFSTDNLLYFALFFLAYFAALLVLIVLHELIHALFFLPGCEKGWKSIHFGIKQMTPYCHCMEIITMSQFRRSLWGPLWILCTLLAATSVILGDPISFLLTLVMIFGSGGDLYVLWATRKYRGSTTLVFDLEDQVGCEVYLKADPAENK
jgi:hypothetical protein